METINLQKKFDQISTHWHPHVVAEANGQHIRLAKLKDEFVWHSHAEEDELFIVIKGTLTVQFRDRSEQVSEGEMLVIPRGVEHRPVAEEEVLLVNITQAGTTHTGSTESEITVPLSQMPRI